VSLVVKLAGEDCPASWAGGVGRWVGWAGGVERAAAYSRPAAARAAAAWAASRWASRSSATASASAANPGDEHDRDDGPAADQAGERGQQPGGVAGLVPRRGGLRDAAIG